MATNQRDVEKELNEIQKSFEGLEKQSFDELNKPIGQNGETKLQLAVKSNDIERVKSLLKYKADPNIADNNKKTPLLFCIENYNYFKNEWKTCFRMLLENGADPNRTSIKCTQNPFPNLQINYRLSLYEYLKKFNQPIFEELEKYYKSKPPER